MNIRQVCLAVICVLLIMGMHQFASAQTPQDNQRALNRVAEQYVKLVLKVGQFSPDYVDAYVGPADWKPAPLTDSMSKFPYAEYSGEVSRLLDTMTAIGKLDLTVSQRRRWRTLDDLIHSSQAVIELLNGKKMTFDEESMAIYHGQAPSFDSLHYDTLLNRLDGLLPGTGDLQTRFVEFRKRFLVPHDKIDTLVRAAIAFCRDTTKKYIALPDSERFVVELVSRKPWGAYNWYKGNLVSLIQIDTTKDIGIESIIGLSAHEGYPGHHVQNLFEDGRYYHDSGWVEYCVAPLFAPRNLLGEGEANYGADLVFPKATWLKFMKGTICPIAGIDTAGVERYYAVLKAAKALKYAEIQNARDYVDGRKSKEAAIASAMYYGLVTRKEAEDVVDFYHQYRSYIITYSVGEDLIRSYIEANGGTEDNPARQWELYKSLLVNPVTAADLQAAALLSR